jgi:hypothetical protein
MKSNYAEGITEWLAESAANRWQRVAEAHLGVRKAGQNGVEALVPWGFYSRRRERERLRARSSTSGRRRLAGPAGPWCESPSTVPGH